MTYSDAVNQAFICIFHFITQEYATDIVKGNTDTFSNWRETAVYTFFAPTSENLLY